MKNINLLFCTGLLTRFQSAPYLAPQNLSSFASESVNEWRLYSLICVSGLCLYYFGNGNSRINNIIIIMITTIIIISSSSSSLSFVIAGRSSVFSLPGKKQIALE
jgi:hypothetical protein